MDVVDVVGVIVVITMKRMSKGYSIKDSADVTFIDKATGEVIATFNSVTMTMASIESTKVNGGNNIKQKGDE